MVHHDACPLCSSEKINLQFNCTDFFVSKEIFPVWRCSECGFVFTQDHPGEKEIGSYYESEEYISHSDTSKGLLNKLYRFARSLMLNKKTKLVIKTTGLKTGTLLDVGSGTGHFAASMKQAGWDVAGIEINDRAREFSVSNFKISVLSPDKISSLKNESFDCITLWHVLEHFNAPDGYMSEISRLLKPGGTCIIALPNCNSHDADHYQKFWAAYDVPRHLWHFQPETFGRFIKKSGFRLKGMKNLPLDVFYISTLSEKYKGSGTSFISGMIKGSWFWFLSLFTRKKSSSLIYILEPTT